MSLEGLQQAVRAAVEDPTLTYRQRVQLLASLAENALDPHRWCRGPEALDKRVICDMYEGNAPYRPATCCRTTPLPSGRDRSSSSSTADRTSTRR